MPKNGVEFKAHYDPNRVCIRIDGDGRSTLTLTADATQLAKVLNSFSLQKEGLLLVKMKRLPGECQYGRRKKTRKGVQVIK